MNATLEDGHGSERVVSHCELNSALRGGEGVVSVSEDRR